MLTLKANRSFKYAGKKMQAEDTFEASDKDAKILCALQMASGYRASVKEEEKPKRTYKKRAMTNYGTRDQTTQ